MQVLWPLSRLLCIKRCLNVKIGVISCENAQNMNIIRRLLCLLHFKSVKHIKIRAIWKDKVEICRFWLTSSRLLHIKMCIQCKYAFDSLEKWRNMQALWPLSHLLHIKWCLQCKYIFDSPGIIEKYTDFIFLTLTLYKKMFTM